VKQNSRQRILHRAQYEAKIQDVYTHHMGRQAQVPKKEQKPIKEK